MKRTKKRVEQEPMDMGKEKVEQLQHEANEAVHAFFYSNRPPIKKKSEKKKLKLAVPVSESTPFVKEMEQSGAGFVYNPTTGTTKAVGKGKHATKGRGIVSDQVIITKQLPTLNVEEITQSSSIIEACEPKISIEPGTADVADTSALTQDVVIVETIEADANEEEILKKSKWVIGTQMEGAPYFEDDGMIPSKPVYSNEVWAAGTIRTIRKEMVNAKKPVPKFYVRRDEPPREFQITFDDPSSSVPTKEIWGKLLTFHENGTFTWPASTTHLCWNCCHSFDGPPAMVPRYLNRTHKYYEVYGNFCSWSCAKLFASDTTQEYYSDSAPSLDYFAWKYFGAVLPIPMIPPRYVLSAFSSFGMSIEEYREVGKVTINHEKLAKKEFSLDYRMNHPPCIPYELLVTWQKKKPEKARPTKGYEKDKKRLFEQRMAGEAPLPDMPTPIAAGTATMSDIQPGKLIPQSASKKKSKKNLLSLIK